LRHRDHSGTGQVVDLSLLEPLFSLLGPLAAEYRLIGRVRERIGNRSYNSAPRNTYRTREGQWVAISASTPAMAVRFFQAIGRSDLLAEERFATNEARVRHVDELDGVVAAEIARHTLPELLARFDAHKVGAAPVYDITQLLDDAHVRARGMIVDVAGPDGVTPMHEVIPRLLGTPGRIRWAGPHLGAHNEEIYGGELSLPEGELLRLRDEGVV
ncbi:MAG: CoA transferase, partial [Thermodesulfobacteriota bacterium]